MLWLMLVVGFLTGSVSVGLPLFCGVCWWMRRAERVTEQRDSLALQLANAMLELRTDAVLEMWTEDEEEGE